MRIYVAGPITKGNTMHNVHTAIKVGDELMKLGFCPFVPHANIMWDMVSPHSYEDWCKWDDEWLKQCHAILRIPGESKGAEAEIALARTLDIPVFYAIDDLVAWRKAGKVRR